jgi:hypothetical protein
VSNPLDSAGTIHDQPPEQNVGSERRFRFMDLRGRPDRAKEIGEGDNSPALRNLLVGVAQIGSPIFTLGCDLGAHTEPTQAPRSRREVAGGYVQIASVNYHSAQTEAYAAFANSIVVGVRARSGQNRWKIDFVGKW